MFGEEGGLGEEEPGRERRRSIGGEDTTPFRQLPHHYPIPSLPSTLSTFASTTTPSTPGVMTWYISLSHRKEGRDSRDFYFHLLSELLFTKGSASSALKGEPTSARASCDSLSNLFDTAGHKHPSSFPQLLLKR